MPFDPSLEPLHTGTDLELIKKLTRECSSEYQVACKALAALGWRFDGYLGMWWRPDGSSDPPSISHFVIEEITNRLDEGKQLNQIFRGMGWEREARIIVRACEDLPTVVRVANHMAKYGK